MLWMLCLYGESLCPLSCLGVVRGRSRCSESVAVTDPSILPLNTGFVPTTGVIPTTGKTLEDVKDGHMISSTTVIFVPQK